MNLIHNIDEPFSFYKNFIKNLWCEPQIEQGITIDRAREIFVFETHGMLRQKSSLEQVLKRLSFWYDEIKLIEKDRIIGVKILKPEDIET